MGKDLCYINSTQCALKCKTASNELAAPAGIWNFNKTRRRSCLIVLVYTTRTHQMEACRDFMWLNPIIFSFLNRTQELQLPWLWLCRSGEGLESISVKNVYVGKREDSRGERNRCRRGYEKKGNERIPVTWRRKRLWPYHLNNQFCNNEGKVMLILEFLFVFGIHLQLTINHLTVLYRPLLITCWVFGNISTIQNVVNWNKRFAWHLEMWNYMSAVTPTAHSSLQYGSPVCHFPISGIKKHLNAWKLIVFSNADVLNQR